MTTKETRQAHQAAFRERRAAFAETARQAHGERIAELVAEDLADEDLCRALAGYVARYRAEHGRGPTWRELAEQARPDAQDDIAPGGCQGAVFAVYANDLCTGLVAAGWITVKTTPGSMQPGPAYLQASPAR